MAANNSTKCPNGTSNLLEYFGHKWDDIHAHFTPSRSLSHIMIIWIVIGVPGSILSFLVWTRKGMRHSSSIYLSALALADLAVLLLAISLYLQQAWSTPTLDFPVWCELYPVLFIWAQYSCPLLTLAFTVERFISVCFPFNHERYCTTSLATKVTCGILLGSFMLALVQIAVHTFDYDTRICDQREWVSTPQGSFAWIIWSYCSDLVIFAVVPLAILFFNILVILEMQRMTRRSQGIGGGEVIHAKSTTITLLCVSFCLFFGTLPPSLVFVLTLSFPEGPTCISIDAVPFDPLWERYLNFVIIKTTVNIVCSGHYALNFYIYILTGAAFRHQFKQIVMDMFGKRPKCCARDNGQVSRRCYSTMTNMGRSVRVKNGAVDSTYV